MLYTRHCREYVTWHMVIWCLCYWQWMDLINQHDQHKLGCGCGHDGSCRLFHHECCAGCHPTENGMLMWRFYNFSSQQEILSHFTVCTLQIIGWSTSHLLWTESLSRLCKPNLNIPTKIAVYTYSVFAVKISRDQCLIIDWSCSVKHGGAYIYRLSDKLNVVKPHSNSDGCNRSKGEI